MNLLTFLGATKAYETTYVMPGGQTFTAPFCGVALARFFPGSTMHVFVTKDAREQHLVQFQALVEDYVEDLQVVDICDGQNEDELWKIFQAVVDNVAQREQVVFDITHGFRSLPFLSFLAAAYLRVVKEISLEAVLYGAFEARDRNTEPNRAPIIDMTPFVSLLDWMIAADRFTRFGDAHDLAKHLRKVKPDYRAQQADKDVWHQAIRLSQAASAMDAVSLALRLIRPEEAMHASEQLQQRLADGMAAISKHARPFHPLAQQVSDVYAPLSMSREAQRAHPESALARERRMVGWYVERRQYVQAMAVAREWIISWAMLHLGFSDLLEKELRKDVEKALTSANKQRESQHGAFANRVFDCGKGLHDIPQIVQALDLYQRLGNARNDLLHAGKRPAPRKANQMEKTIANLCEELQSLPLPTADQAGSQPPPVA